jgi:tetratricopeptide (TPR) repeat protein
MMLGKHDSAHTENRAALALEPTSPRLIADLAGSYFTMRRFAVAESLYRAALELEPTSLNSQLRLSAVLSATGRHLEAVAVATLAGRAPRAMASLAEALAHAGRRQEAWVLLDSLEQRAAREYVDPTAVAIAWGALGEKDRAFPWLERGYADRSQELLFLDHPRLDPLRGDPRFDALRRRIGLPGG